MKIKEKKQFEALKVLKRTEQKLTIKDAILEDRLNEEAKNEIGKILKMEKMVKREDLVYKTMCCMLYGYNI